VQQPQLPQHPYLGTELHRHFSCHSLQYSTPEPGVPPAISHTPAVSQAPHVQYRKGQKVGHTSRLLNGDILRDFGMALACSIFKESCMRLSQVDTGTSTTDVALTMCTRAVMPCRAICDTSTTAVSVNHIAVSGPRLVRRYRDRRSHLIQACAPNLHLKADALCKVRSCVRVDEDPPYALYLRESIFSILPRLELFAKPVHDRDTAASVLPSEFEIQ
jgi:hypothetical protein